MSNNVFKPWQVLGEGEKKKYTYILTHVEINKPESRLFSDRCYVGIAKTNFIHVPSSSNTFLTTANLKCFSLAFFETALIFVYSCEVEKNL